MDSPFDCLLFSGQVLNLEKSEVSFKMSESESPYARTSRMMQCLPLSRQTLPGPLRLQDSLNSVIKPGASLLMTLTCWNG